ncbi:MAG: hypothetical protein A2408_03170 [Candidatus Yonathbacteria bacterium RIFOXYC1_FULL_52_10]|uniref:Uncharacterized protein n=1 Tax=Candidatus Yonathbacteria bacterium RIFOXYD1_FULL_52_36 TaxID=1802730 RepID=A0A1G2SIP0_9BACT|nr:MAG: hypothetical protein A2408_03170 [Candidatus Yonathbacteria bacterium RIFOXYC1_FULL_52_10]OHA84915.1 MAG: hypothetical protein A2591_01145 [Candidatus Yonathbacteria bacterium RIFOXYD1_FULL_52_36]
MKNNNDAKKIAELFLARYLTFKFASECVSLMEKTKNDVSDAGGAYLFLASNALELYAKSFMCLRWEKYDNLDIEEINKRASAFGHELDHIYHYQGVGEDFMLTAGVKKVKLSKQKSNGKTFNHHYFDFYLSNEIIRVYPVESLRYGVLTPKKNDFMILEQTKLLNLCKAVRNAVLVEAKQYLKW